LIGPVGPTIACVPARLQFVHSKPRLTLKAGVNHCVRPTVTISGRLTFALIGTSEKGAEVDCVPSSSWWIIER
jgi:hypothetical protein